MNELNNYNRSRNDADVQSSMPLMTFHGSGIDDSDLHSEDEEDPLESVLKRLKYRPQLSQPHDFWPSVLLAASLSLVLGFILSYVAFIVGQSSIASHSTVFKEIDLLFGSQLGKLASEQDILDFIFELNEEGVNGEVSRLHHHFLGQGFDDSYIFNYTTISRQADPQHTNKVSILNEIRGVVHASYPINISTTYPTADIDVKSQIVYINYGFAEDWLQLETENVTVEDKIVVARTGILWPEDIAAAAYLRGAKALLIYTETEGNYPFWFPHSVKPGAGGRLIEEQGFQIPVASIAKHDAENILRIMMLDIEGDSWDVARPGPSVKGALHLQAKSVPRISVLTNVLAVLGGREEPDRYVIIGAHRTGSRNETAAILELATVFGKMKASKGWRPRRTLILASWGGEGSAGAAAWVTEFQRSLKGRAIAYIDLHQLEQGDDFTLVKGSALMRQAVQQAVPLVPGVSELGVNLKAGELSLPGCRGSCPPFIHVAPSSCLSLRFTNVSALTTAVRLGSVVGWLLAESSLLPCNVRHLADAVADSLLQLHNQHDKMLAQHGLSFETLDRAAMVFTTTADRFQQHIDKNAFHNGVQLREMNDQIRQLASVFVLPYFSETRDEFTWPSSYMPSGSGFGHLQDILIMCSLTSHRAEHELDLQLHTEQLALALNSASALLLPPAQLQ